MVLLLEEHQILDSSFLELVNNILCAGMAHGLYAPEELEPLLSSLRESAAEEGHHGSVLSYFVKRVRSNLHVALVMDSLSQNIVTWCEANPGFYSYCSFQSMDKWSEKSLVQLPHLLLNRSMSLSEDTCHQFYDLHSSVPTGDAPPRKYVELIRSYQAIYTERKSEINKHQHHLQAGVSKLDDAKSLVSELKKTAAEQETVLAVKQSEADEALTMITKAMEVNIVMLLM